jgi:hypothetical protein
MASTNNQDLPLRRRSTPECAKARESDPAALAQLLDAWAHGDEMEQRESFEILRQHLERRPVGYKLLG